MISIGGSTGLEPNNSRARASSIRTSSSCCCSPESAMAPRYPARAAPTIQYCCDRSARHRPGQEPTARDLTGQKMTVRLAGRGLRPEFGAPAPPENDSGLPSCRRSQPKQPPSQGIQGRPATDSGFRERGAQSHQGSGGFVVGQTVKGSASDQHRPCVRCSTRRIDSSPAPRGGGGQ